MVLAIVYMAGVLGFDVHSSADTHRSYVIPLFNGISCERIHPEALCHHHGHAECEDDEDCCHDTIELLEVTGEYGADAKAVLPDMVSVCLQVINVQQVVFACADAHITVPEDYSPPAPDLAELCILRI